MWWNGNNCAYLRYCFSLKKFETARFPPSWREARPSDRSEHLGDLASLAPGCHVMHAGAAAAHLCALFSSLYKRLTCLTGRTGLRRAGQVRKGGRRRRGSTSRKETGTWCADATAPTPTESRIHLLIPICGGRTRSKSFTAKMFCVCAWLECFSSEMCGGRFHLCGPAHLQNFLGVSLWRKMCSKFTI